MGSVYVCLDGLRTVERYLTWISVQLCILDSVTLGSVELGNKVLVSHTSERDLGLIVQSNLKVDMQRNKAASEANKRLGMIKSNFRF